MSGEKKLIYFLVALIILLSITLLIKIKKRPQYDPKIYSEIYDEYEDIFGKENDMYKIDESIIQNIVENNSITKDNSTHTTVAKPTTNNREQGYVIGKIIIPKIEISYPIIKETTEEYLKIAPTKYCGPKVNDIRKFSYSRA